MMLKCKMPADIKFYFISLLLASEFDESTSKLDKK